ncbi:MAG TPA: hypothetical protein VGM30_09465 [Puia sp.]
MKSIVSVKIVFRQITWLFLGLCFVVLYSCPVKKFILLTFDKTHPLGTGSSHFRKDLSLQVGKIVYLNRASSRYTVSAPVRVLKPAMPPRFAALTVSSGFTASKHDQPAKQLLQLYRQRAFAIDPPMYLQCRRWQI